MHPPLLHQVFQINKHSLQMPKLLCRMRSQIVRMKPLLCAQPARLKRWREANFAALPDGRKLAATLMKAKKANDGNSSDLLLEKEGEGATDLAAAFSLPVPSSTSRISPDLGLNNELQRLRGRGMHPKQSIQIRF